MSRATLILALLLSTLPLNGRAECGASRIESLCQALAESLHDNLQTRLERTVPIITAPFADLHNVKQTSPLGRILAEELGNNFAAYGYRIADPRAFIPNPYTIKEHGESALSAVPDQAGATTGSVTVLTGTYAMADGGLRISARLVQTQNHTVLAAASCRLRLTPEVSRLLETAPTVAKAQTPPAPLLNLKKKADAKRVQQALTAQGLYKGKIDGVWGKQSKAALTRFRASMAMPATAVWDEATQKALLPPS